MPSGIEICAADASATLGKTTTFDYALLKGYARELATCPYLSRKGELSESLKDLSWGDGSVHLVEIPTQGENFDNIVAFSNPAQPIEAGLELLFS